MSLFPAYSANTNKSNEPKDLSKENDTTNWLYNSSCSKQITSDNFIRLSSESSDEIINEIPYLPKEEPSHAATSLDKGKPVLEEKVKSRHIKKKRKDKRKDVHGKLEKSGYRKNVENVYFEDKYRERGYNTVKTLNSRLRPYYDVKKSTLGFIPYKQSKKINYKRYYVKNIDHVEKKKKDPVISRESTTNLSKEEEYTPLWHIKLEELQKAKTKEYNEKLTDNPNDVTLWLEFIEFQDTLGYFQQYQTAKDIHRATTLRKLSIVEKALEKNADSTILLKVKLSLMGELSPADELSKQLETLVNKNSGSIILWQEFIMTVQTSVAMCTVPKVLDLYSKCFCILKQKARTNPRVYDGCLLQMLYWCLTFLRHTGLWEQMWETMRLNVILNLSLNKDSLTFRKTIDEKKLIGMEEVILMSRLPLNQLWQRTESLRENCHWISVNRSELELVGDSRRFVLPDDVADFVHPILSRNLNFRMAIHVLLLLKVPLLPTRDYMLRTLKLEEFEWGVETSEVLLPFAYPMIGEMTGRSERQELLSGLLEGRLTSGPQYLMFHPAQESYLDFIREIFFTIAENLSPLQRTSIFVWWLRFERLLIFLQKHDPLNMNDTKLKKLKTTLKVFLKKDENRNNLHFYREYALIEKEMGKFDNCVNILQTAIQSQGACPSAIHNPDERSALVSLYRTLAETLLNVETYEETNKTKILDVMKQMVPEAEADPLSQVEKYLEKCVQSFLEVACPENEEDAYFLPNLHCDTIVCYAYLLYVRDSDFDRAISIFKNCVDHYKDCQYIQEILQESQLALTQLHFKLIRNESLLKTGLDDMLNLYPNNFYALSVLACIESKLPIWKSNSQVAKLQLWKAFALCLAYRKRIRYLQKLEDYVSMNAAINKLMHLHQTLARIPKIKNCPLLWRLYMLLLREYNLCEKKGEEIYHESVVLCPWARSIYIDAAEVAPQVLTQVQDVIREKELRMHVTPEELDILRG
ncbi:protein NRDE2 homolog [Ceratina calcarata]|uniref:Protein NRDE2 homolog n=1 Tax=Ceratina calcarata TaxID=156304 RepID=A0AAJ7W972_9HYME|nr:protein NRDE2 homolog [Ceratina calcarata]XP_026667821.1 protein NRDE2 homolog [Ceratina calcarata]XP_026667822.1 protein NRDE2 homolog [Ceratina calcarata]